MPRINILAPHVADLIAAGEVVERPASAVKELVENAVDAGARNITVELAGGGSELIRVTDDGCGMSPEDAGVAFLRHATSKLADERGLEAIGTLGFRGEALAAISSVSHIELTTCERGAERGRLHDARGRRHTGDAPGRRARGHEHRRARPLFQHARPAQVPEERPGRGRGLRPGGAALRAGQARRLRPLHPRRARGVLHSRRRPARRARSTPCWAARRALAMLPVSSGLEGDALRAARLHRLALRRARQPERAVFLRERPAHKEPAPAGRRRAGLYAARCSPGASRACVIYLDC